MSRPPLSDSLGEDEFRRWYWTLAELRGFARSIDVPAGGNKRDVTERIAAHLGGRPAPVSSRRPTTPQLEGHLSRQTVIPAGQKASQALRSFFETEIGPAFRFDGHMRSFLADSANATLGDAVEHWRATRGTPLPTQSASLEFNAFTKEWHRHHPDRTATECREAWHRYRSLPVDERPPVGEA